MKQLKFLLIALLASLSSMAALAEDFTITVILDNPESVICTVGGTQRDLVAGENIFTEARNTLVKFQSVAPFYINKVTDQNDKAQYVSRGEWSVYPSMYTDGYVYTIDVINLNDQRDGQFTINVDDPSLISAQLTGWNQKVTLNKGTNTVPFSIEKEKELSISSTSSNPIYSVKLNNESITPSQGIYTVTLENGCTVDIIAVIPDIDVNLTFSYSENGEGAIKSVIADGTELTDFDGKKATVKAGQKIQLVPNPDYKFDAFAINGKTTIWTGTYNYSTTILMDTEFRIDAHPYGNLPYTVIVDDPTNITLYQGQAYDSDKVVIRLNPGENQLEIPEKDPVVSWRAADDCYITSVTINGNSYGGNYENVTKDMVIEFVTGKIVYDNTAVIWVDQPESTSYCEYSGSGDNAKTPAAGYNIIRFNDDKNPFTIEWWPKAGSGSALYLDGELQSPLYSGGYNYSLTIPDQGVVKIFVVEQPVECAVSFTADDDVQATVKYDIVKDLENWRGGLNCFKGTQVNIAGEGINVAVGDNNLERNEDGDYVFTVADPATSVAITKDTNVGVESVIAEESDDDAVYTLMGTKAGTRASMQNLAPGIYVVGGKKVVKK